jgi:hypothetical protein
VEREFHIDGITPQKNNLLSAVQDVKPKFSMDDIKIAVEELQEKSYINLS